MSPQYPRLLGPGSSHGNSASRRSRPFRRRALWRIAFAVPMAAMLSGAGVIIWATVYASRSLVLWNVGAALIVFGFAVGVICLGVWVASGGHLRQSDQP